MSTFDQLLEPVTFSISAVTEKSHFVLEKIRDYLAEEYKRNYYSKTILHRTEPVKLNDFYQPIFIRKFGKNYVDERLDTRSASRLFSSNRFITLLGTAGSGKSTIVKYLLTNSIDENFKIPIKVELRYLNKYDGDLENYIIGELLKLTELQLEKKALNKFLNSGLFVFFFDGYDELSSHIKERTTREINEFTKVFSTNYYLLTSRPYTNIELLSGFSNFEVCELNEDEIEQFVKKQIPSNETEITSKILEAINEDSSESYKTFLSNPLLLSMFILTFQTYSNIPPKKSTFYHQVFDSLYYLHDSMSKLAYDREKKSGLSKEQFEQVLKMFSYISFFKQVFVFDEIFINHVLDKIKESKKNLVFNNGHLLDDLQIAICILQKEGLDYVFPHRSLQEYFSSLYLVSLEGKAKTEAYSKLYSVVASFSIVELLTKDNFFNLLVEQDENGVIRNLTIPFFEEVVDKLKANTGLNKNETIITSLLYYINVTHSELDILKDVFTKLRSYNSGRMGIVQTHLINTGTKNAPSYNLSLKGNEKIKELSDPVIRYLKTNLPKIVKALKVYLADDLESDISIIDLIS